MSVAFPPAVLVLVSLDLLIAVGWVAVYIRGSRVPRRISLVSAAFGVWFLGLGIALWHITQVGDVAATSGIGDASRMARHLGDSLVIAASATTGFFWLTLMSIIGMAIPTKKTAIGGAPI